MSYRTPLRRTRVLPPWEDEHGCGIVLRNGLPVGWGSADVYIGRFEEKTP